MNRNLSTLGLSLLIAGSATLLGTSWASADHNGNIDVDCDDFSSTREATDFLLSTGNDVHRLDGDDDGVACESVFGDLEVVDPDNSPIEVVESNEPLTEEQIELIESDVNVK